ncbi:MAG: HTTM domain-containing protein [Flavobacteriales bacterium]|nr:HTTM domain-containing protein [Flavobacteriales bacterium]
MKFLFRKVDNSPIVVFRIFFGFLMMLESFGAIATGWVYKTFVEPLYSFPFFGFEFSQNLLGNYFYIHFILMGVISIFVMLGYFYRITSILLFLFWSFVYFSQKINYNNHYYLMVLISLFMCLIPAHKYASLDVKTKRVKSEISTPYWTILIFILQIAIVYFYAAIAKFYPGWLENKFLSIRLNYSANWFIDNFGWYTFADFLRNTKLQYFLSYSGILFDLLIVPALLYKKTRWIAFISTLVFHIFNSIVLHIGIFPYFALSFSVFFFSRETIHKLFLKKKEFYIETKNEFDTYNGEVVYFLFLYFLIQVALPIRHHFITGDVLWNEEGHRLSWRMMLRSKAGNLYLNVKDKSGKFIESVDLSTYLTDDQINVVKSKPDLIYALVQLIKKEYKLKGVEDIQIYATSLVSINGSRYVKFIDSNIDLAKVEWNYFTPNTWILPAPKTSK